MKSSCIAFTILAFALQCRAEQPTAATLAAAFQNIAVDPDQTYRVRDLQFSRGDIKIYLNEGVLSFATPVAGHVVAAIFTTQASEAGDAEILLLPPRRSERASLASFTKSPNLDEHFNSAAFVFSDRTAEELLTMIQQAPIRKASNVALQNRAALNAAVRGATAEAGIRLMQALLDNHPPQEGFFYSFLAGRTLGGFDVFYEPSNPEPISVGRPIADASQQGFQLWTAFRPRHAAPVTERSPVLSDYRIETTIHDDLSMASVANFACVPDASAGRVLAFGLSEHLRVTSALVDGKAVEVYQPEALHVAEQERGRGFLLIAEAPLETGIPHPIEVHYEGSVIRQTGQGGYFVDERNVWYPHVWPMRTNFDLTFHFASHLTLVSTGELVSDNAANGIRVVHRKTRVPEGMAGFNLGDYKSSVEDQGIYRVETYADRKSAESLQTVAQKTAAVLDYYTKAWTPLPIHSIAVTPIAGTFGQGFPGLIYLSTLAYLRAEDRPVPLQNARVDTFFSQMMLPHEVAHQWWGNVVIPADYRTVWLLEAMANYSALQVLENTEGKKAVDAVLDSYRSDLLGQENGSSVESIGPVDFGLRLLDTAGMAVWHKIVYEKGTWILHMLRQRLGDDGFRHMQLKLLQDFAAKPVDNEDFRRVASQFLPPGQPDRHLELFFDAWVYGTGIPKMSLAHSGDGPDVVVSGIDDDFTADVPVQCQTQSGREQLRWVRFSSGSNPVDPHGVAGACELPASSDYLYSH